MKKKLCKDCIYCKPTGFKEYKYAKCTRRIRTNKVNGQNQYPFCELERGFDYNPKFCGPKGKFFKRKKK